MERRVLIAIFLSFIVLYVYQALVVKPAPKTPGPSPASSSSPPSGRASSAPLNSAATPESPAAPRAESQVSAATVVGETGERDIRIETRDVIAVFTNRGGRLKS